MLVKLTEYAIESEELNDYSYSTSSPIEIVVEQGTFRVKEKNGGLEIVAMYENGSMLIAETKPELNPNESEGEDEKTKCFDRNVPTSDG